VTISKPFPAALWGGGRTLGDPRLSPDGSQVSFVAVYPHGAELVVTTIDGGPEVWLPVSPRISRATATNGGVHGWIPDGSGIVYIGKDGHIHLHDFESGSTNTLTKEPGELSALAVAPNGTSVAYVVELKDVKVTTTDGISDTVAHGETVRLSTDADFAFDPVWSPDSEFVAWHEWDVPNMPWDGGRIVVRSADASDAVRTIAGDENVSVQQPRFSPDGKYIAYLSDESGWLNVWIADAKTFDKARPLIAEEFEHAEPSWGPGARSYTWTRGGDGIAYCRNEAGFGRLCAFDVASGTGRAQPQSDFVLSLDACGKTMIGIRSGATRGNQLDVFSPEGARTLAFTMPKGLAESGVVPEVVEWKSGDGATIHGRLYRAPSSQGDFKPLIVWVHGGPTHQSMATSMGRWNYFLQRGWSILVPDYRGSTGWGRAYQQEMREQWGEVDVADVTSGIDAAFANGWGSAQATALVGGSAGGLTVLLSMIERPELAKAGVVMYPVVDLISAATESWRFEAHYMETLAGPLEANRETYIARSPLERAEKIAAPLLVLHGDSDIVVPVQTSKMLVERIERNDGTVELQVYEGEGHGWRRPETRIDELERMERFINHYVLGAL
jgi:dipeptidyl aminopeptidase/acylaminoacyl peptidase